MLDRIIDNNAQYGWDAEKVRNMDCKDGKLYLVYDHSYIKVVDARDGKYLYDLNNTGVEGGLLPLCDVRAFDGKIVACNIGGIDGNGNTHSLKIYVWDDNDTSLPTVTEIPYETLSANNIMRLGDYIEVGGSWDSGRLIFVHDNYGKISGVTGGTYIVEFALANGAINKTPNAPIEVTNSSSLTNFNFVLSYFKIPSIPSIPLFILSHLNFHNFSYHYNVCYINNYH